LSVSNPNDVERLESNWNVAGSSSTLNDGLYVLKSNGGGNINYPQLGGGGVGSLVQSSDAISGSITSGVSIACGTTTGWAGTLYARYSLELWY
jgi:hypothetical protein